MGANSNIFSKKLVDKINLKKTNANMSVSGLSEMSLDVKSKVKAFILNKNETYELKFDCLVQMAVKLFGHLR